MRVFRSTKFTPVNKNRFCSHTRLMWFLDGINIISASSRLGTGEGTTPRKRGRQMQITQTVLFLLSSVCYFFVVFRPLLIIAASAADVLRPTAESQSSFHCRLERHIRPPACPSVRPPLLARWPIRRVSRFCACVGSIKSVMDGD